MKNFILISIVILFSSALKSQNASDIPAGVWISNGIESQSNGTNGEIEWYSIRIDSNGESLWRQYIFNRNFPDTIVQPVGSGIYLLSGGIFIPSNGENYFAKIPQNYKFDPTIIYNDSLSLVITTGYLKDKLKIDTLRFVKTDSLCYGEHLYPFGNYCCSHPIKEWELVKFNHPERKIKISNYSWITLTASSLTKDSIPQSYSNRYSGTIVSVSDSDLIMKVQSHTVIFDPNAYAIGSETRFDYERLQEPEVRINLNELITINYRTGFNQAALVLSGSIFGLCLADALIAAPLLSINPSNFEFNEHKYYRLAAYGLSGAVLMIPVMALTGNHFYFVFPSSYHGNDITRNYWYFKKNP